MRSRLGKNERKLTLNFSTDSMNAFVEAGIITAEQKALNPKYIES